MAVTDSRLGPGTLTIGTNDYGMQASNVRLTPSNDSTDGTPTLGEPNPAPILTTSWELSGSAIQDWEADTPDGFVEYCRANNNTVVTFEWVPNTGKTVTYTGTCQIQAVEIGGDVNTQITTDFTFPVVGDITRGVHTPAAMANRATSSK